MGGAADLHRQRSRHLGRRDVAVELQVAILARYSHKSGGYRNALSSLRTASLIEGRGDIEATTAGRSALGPVDPLPTGAELRDWWQDNVLGLAERRIVDVLAEAYPAPVDTANLAERTGYSPTSGGYRNALSDCAASTSPKATDNYCSTTH